MMNHQANLLYDKEARTVTAFLSRIAHISVILLLALLLSGCASKKVAVDVDDEAENAQLSEEEKWLLDDEELDLLEEESLAVSDPLEPMNRMFFHFNDKLYFWLLKPVARAYSYAVPEDIRISIRNFFTNLEFPVREANSLLQGKWKESGIELSRFLINSTFGVAGLFDPAKDSFNLPPSEEDFGQTLGTLGAGSSVYFCWPFFGPSNIRDSFGLAGDYFLHPLTYLSWADSQAGYALFAEKNVNNTSLKIGDYEALKESSLDPYVALRDAYLQYRDNKIKE